MIQVTINIWAVVVAAAANMAIGAAWYSNFLFGKSWQKLAKVELKEMRREAGKKYGIVAVGSLVMAYVLAHFVQYAGAVNAIDGAKTGFWLWFGIVAPVMGATYLFENRRKKLFLINAGYPLVSLIIMAAILAVWV